MAHPGKTQKRGRELESTIPSAGRAWPPHRYTNWLRGRQQRAMPTRPDWWCGREPESSVRPNRRKASRPPCVPVGARHQSCAATSGSVTKVDVAVTIGMRVPVLNPEQLQLKLTVF